MARWLTALILLLILTGSVLAGASVFAGGDQSGMSAMDCCKKKGMNVASQDAARFCCAINCNNPSPTSPNGAFNFSPSAQCVTDSVLTQIVSLLGKERVSHSTSFSFERETLTRSFQPKYIQHHSFLI